MIRVCLRTHFGGPKAERTSEVIQRMHTAFTRAGLDPSVRFTIADRSAGKISGVQRAVKRFPELSQFDHTCPVAGQPARSQRLIGNDVGAPACGVPVNLLLLKEAADGIPKRYPFFRSTTRITHPLFGKDSPGPRRDFLPGLLVEDMWGNPRRSLALRSQVIVDADATSASLPDIPDAVQAVLDAYGKGAGTEPFILDGLGQHANEAAAAIAANVKERLGEIVERARVPHAFPQNGDEQSGPPVGARKPILANALRPLGYDCRGDGMMGLLSTRRSASNITTRLSIDFGTMRDYIYSIWSAHWLGQSLQVWLPNYPMSGHKVAAFFVDETRWRQIVANLAALVMELDRSVLPVIEQVAGPAPAWYRPSRAGGPTHRLHVPKPAQTGLRD